MNILTAEKKRSAARRDTTTITRFGWLLAGWQAAGAVVAVAVPVSWGPPTSAEALVISALCVRVRVS